MKTSPKKNFPIVALENIHLVRNRFSILTGINWNIDSGEHWGLLGSNGAGKTSLLKIITGYEWPTAGKIKVLGAEYGHYDLRLLRRKIGWVSHSLEARIPPQDTALEVVLSGFDASFGIFRAFSEKEKKAAHKTLNSLGCSHVAHRGWNCLSQGEKQLTILARALTTNPVLLILDEPCGGLDPAAREDFLLALKRLAQSTLSPTLLLVTHHIEEIGSWIQKVMLLRQGQILAQGKTKAIITSANISRTFQKKFTISLISDRYQLNPDVENK